MGEIGLFPLGVVLLPGERIPLHVFEPRYRELIGECLELGVPFGLVFADESGLREIGTEAAVVEVSRSFEDGRLIIIVEGSERFRIVELTEGRSFATARVAVVHDEDEEPAPEELARCLAAFRALAAEAGAEPGDPDVAGARIAYWIGAQVDLGAEAKQGLLELGSERERLLRLSGLLEEATSAVRRERTARERAGGNGRVASP